MPDIPLKKLLLLALTFCFTAFSSIEAEARLPVPERVASGHGVIWGMTFLDQQRLLFTERAGQVKVLDLATSGITDITGLPDIRVQGQGGLMDVAKWGDWLYFTYVKPVAGEGRTTLARARLDGRALVDWQDLLITESADSGGRHVGSRIAFAGRYVFFSIGDRGDRPNGQDLSTHAGTILRLHRDGRVPVDNPFQGIANALPEIWSYGHRNPQGLVFGEGRLWSNEHGPRGGDEINLIERGANYGWPEVSHGKEYFLPKLVSEISERDDVVSPLHVWIPSIAPADLLHYTGDAFPEWRGNLFSAALRGHISRIILDADNRVQREEQLLEDLGERIRSLQEDKNGHLYIGTDNGNIYRLTP